MIVCDVTCPTGVSQAGKSVLNLRFTHLTDTCHTKFVGQMITTTYLLEKNMWYNINNVDTLDSPALAVYKERVVKNIRALITTVNDVSRIRPHVKTNKMADVCRLMMEEGITKFKCATIAEAEMLGSIAAPDVLLAYQPVGPKTARMLTLIERFVMTKYSVLVDSIAGAEQLSAAAQRTPFIVDVFVDLNIGQNRTGIIPERAMELITALQTLPGIRFAGLHAYDGQIADADAAIRTKRVNEGFRPVEQLAEQIEQTIQEPFTIVAGGSPTYAIHAKREGVECSPGTFVFWDWSYRQMMPEEPYEFAALVITRVVSIVDARTITVDLGHKSVGAENPLPRVHFLNAPEAVPRSHSEEHLVLTVPDSSSYSIGDVLYGVPQHVCPTVALYERAAVVENNAIVEEWKVTARDKKVQY
jgi:D-serine deaminase-like pyridoxal phosphate-dependent protein